MMAGQKLTRVGELYHGEDLPVGVPITWDKADRAALNAWWTNRFIPSARSGLVDALSQLGFPNPQQVFQKFGVEPFRPLLGKTGEQQPFLVRGQLL